MANIITWMQSISITSKPSSTVRTYAPMPRRVSNPNWLVSFVIRPKTARGARSMAHLTIVMHTVCSPLNRSIISFDCLGFMVTMAIPKIMENITLINYR